MNSAALHVLADSNSNFRPCTLTLALAIDTTQRKFDSLKPAYRRLSLLVESYNSLNGIFYSRGVLNTDRKD